MFLQLSPPNQVFFRLYLTLFPAFAVYRQLLQACFEITARFLTMPDIGFDGCHLGINAEEGTLRGLNQIIRAVISFPQSF